MFECFDGSLENFNDLNLYLNFFEVYQKCRKISEKQAKFELWTLNQEN